MQGVIAQLNNGLIGSVIPADGEGIPVWAAGQLLRSVAGTDRMLFILAGERGYGVMTDNHINVIMGAPGPTPVMVFVSFRDDGSLIEIIIDDDVFKHTAECVTPLTEARKELLSRRRFVVKTQ